MRYLLISLIFSFNAFSTEKLETEEPLVGVNNGQMMNNTRDALMSYDYIVERSDYLIYKFKQLTFGEYADKVMILAPLISGNIEIQAHSDFNLFYNHHQGRGGLRYNINF